jgi:hypothetical protein
LDVKRDLLYIKGHVPGFSGNWVIIRDAIKRPWHWSWPPPFPTFIPSDKDPHANSTVIDMEPRGNVTHLSTHLHHPPTHC